MQSHWNQWSCSGITENNMGFIVCPSLVSKALLQQSTCTILNMWGVPLKSRSLLTCFKLLMLKCFTGSRPECLNCIFPLRSSSYLATAVAFILFLFYFGLAYLLHLLLGEFDASASWGGLRATGHLWTTHCLARTPWIIKALSLGNKGDKVL